MTTADAVTARVGSAVEPRVALVTTALCVSAGVHAALATVHAEPSAGAATALFALAALATALAIVTMVVSTRLGAYATIAILVPVSAAYTLSRMIELPIVGQQPFDVLGVVTTGVQVAGAIAAASLLRTRATPIVRPPIAICTLIVVYSFLVSFAMPTGHHQTSHHSPGHSHAPPT